MKHLSIETHSVSVKLILQIFAGTIALAAMGLILGMSLYWKGLQCTNAFVIASTTTGLVAYLLQTLEREQKSSLLRQIKTYLCHLGIWLSSLLLFVAAGNKYADKQKELFTGRDNYTVILTALQMEATSSSDDASRINQKPGRLGKVENTRPLFSQNFQRAVKLMRLHQEDMPKDLALFLLLIGGTMATGLSIRMAALNCQINCSGMALSTAALAVLSQGALAGVALLVILAIRKLVF